jgi:hypothetical protein
MLFAAAFKDGELDPLDCPEGESAYQVAMPEMIISNYF